MKIRSRSTRPRDAIDRARSARHDGRAPQPRRREPAEQRRGAGPSAPTVVLHGMSGASDLHRNEAGRARARRASRELRHRLPSVLDTCRRSTSARPRWDTASAGRARPRSTRRKPSKRTISIMGDGGFWHNGLTSGVGNAVFNQSDSVLVVVDNSYTAATGGQDILSSQAIIRSGRRKLSIAEAVHGVGVKWVRTITRTYDVAKMRDVLKEALTTKEKGPKVIVAQSECALNEQRRVRPLVAQAAKEGKRVVRETIRRRCGHLHRRSLVHPSVGMPVADDCTESRSAAHGSRRNGAR